MSPSEAIRALAEPPSQNEAMQAFAACGLPEAEHMHAMVSSPSSVRRHRGVTYHVVNRELPEQSLCRLPSGIYVTSPAFTLLRLGTTLRVEELAFAACTFSSIFSVDRWQGRSSSDGIDYDSGLPKRLQITSLDRLKGYAERSYRAPGSARTVNAVAFAAERARSPMEIAAFLALCLPKRHGGCALPKPLLNHPVQTGYDVLFEADLWWESHRVAVEYLGEPHYEDRAGMRRDVRRANTYIHAGVTSIALTKEHLDNADLLNSVAESLCRSLGIRWGVSDPFRQRQRDLLRRLDEVRRLLC